MSMDITIHSSFLPHDDPDASLAFYRDTLGFEVRNDVGYGGMRWITVGPAGRATSIVLHRRPRTPTSRRRAPLIEMMAKGNEPASSWPADGRCTFGDATGGMVVGADRAAVRRSAACGSRGQPDPRPGLR